MAINPLQAPINYAAMAPQINIGQQFAELGQVLAERQKRTQAEEVKQQFATDLQAAQAAGDQKSWLNMIAKYPQFREAFGDVRKGVNEEQLKNEFTQGFEISNALENNAPEVAMQRVQTIIQAKKNAGKPTKIYEDVFSALESGNIKGAQAGVNLALTALDPDRFTKSVTAKTTAEKAPSEVTEAQAKAQSAAVAAKFAESNAVTDLTKKGWDITKVQEDIKIAKENARIAALNAATARETNVLKRQENELKLQDMIEKRDATVRQVAAEVESQRGDMDNFLNTANRIKQTPREVINSATGPVTSRLPTLGQQTADFEGLVETLGAQSFISQIPKIKGTGALSEKEGDKLQASLQNLSLKQSPDRLIENVNESIRLIEKARKTLSLRSGLPDTPMDIPSMDLSVTAGGKTYTFPTKEAADAYKKAAGIK
jgi:hypothetical protein